MSFGKDQAIYMSAKPKNNSFGEPLNCIGYINRISIFYFKYAFLRAVSMTIPTFKIIRFLFLDTKLAELNKQQFTKINYEIIICNPRWFGRFKI